jgi:hypothetical protein
VYYYGCFLPFTKFTYDNEEGRLNSAPLIELQLLKE